MKKVLTIILFISFIIIFVIVIIKADEEPKLGTDLETNPIEIQTVVEKIKNKTVKEKATIKGQEIAKIDKVAKTTRTKYDIEIVSFKAIEGGVEVFARAWDKDGQIGFGKDGTVDIERFVIINPPILVPDENGDIIREWTERNSFTKEMENKTAKYREDLNEAVLQVIEQTISVKKEIFDDSKIVTGKTGNTTSIFYPAAGANSPVDGSAEANYDVAGPTWADVRDGTGDASSATATNISVLVGESGGAVGYYIRRLIFLFDTSTIDSDTISSATLSLYATVKYVGDDDAQAYVNIYSSNPTTDSNIIDIDYITLGTDEFATSLNITSSISASAYNVFTLTSGSGGGIEHINKTGISKFGTREGHDTSDIPIANSTLNYVAIQMADYDGSGTTQDPKLTAEHEAGGATAQIF